MPTGWEGCGRRRCGTDRFSGSRIPGSATARRKPPAGNSSAGRRRSSAAARAIHGAATRAIRARATHGRAPRAHASRARANDRHPNGACGRRADAANHCCQSAGDDERAYNSGVEKPSHAASPVARAGHAQTTLASPRLFRRRIDGGCSATPDSSGCRRGPSPPPDRPACWCRPALHARSPRSCAECAA
jgi:hypothetical protein